MFPRFLRTMERRALLAGRAPHWPLRLLYEFGLQVPDGTAHTLMWSGDVSLDREATEARRTLCYGAARALRAGLDARPALEQNEPVCSVDLTTARAAWRGAIDAAPLGLELLLAAFVPTVILYPDVGESTEPESLWISERHGPRDWVKGLLLLGDETGAGQRRAAGEVHFLPPVRRGELQLRRKWVETNDVDPPSRHSLAGPFRMLGESELWRLAMLGWREQLVLAGAIATRITVCAVVCAARTLPRVGYVVQQLRWCGRTIVHVPWEALPPELEARLLSTRIVHAVSDEHLACGREPS